MSSERFRSNRNVPESVASVDSTGKTKSFRRVLSRFADKTSMAGVTYINNAKFWWAKVIWCFCLVIAMVAMGLHLWYLIDQYLGWPVQTKIALGFDALPFPEITLCNTNVLHKRRLDKHDGADDLKALLEELRPENLAPDQFDENYDPFAEEGWETTTADTVWSTSTSPTAAPSSRPPAVSLPLPMNTLSVSH